MKRSPKPRVSILSPAFRYTNAASTDIRKLFARVRKEQQKEADTQDRNVVIMVRKLKGKQS